MSWWAAFSLLSLGSWVILWFVADRWGQGHSRPAWGTWIFFPLFFLMTGAGVCHPVGMVHSKTLTNAFIIGNLFFNHFCRLISTSRPPLRPAAAAVSCPQTYAHFSPSFPPVVLSLHPTHASFLSCRRLNSFPTPTLRLTAQIQLMIPVNWY